MTPQIPEGGRGNSRVVCFTAPAEDVPMPVTTVRCECSGCGAHVEVRRGWQLSGQCGNCRGYDLRPVPPTAPVALPLKWAA